VCALAVEECFGRLRAAPVRLCAEFANVPTPQDLVEARVPGVDTIHAALLKVAE